MALTDHNKDFRKELEELLNKYCRENESNTPDFVLADYLVNCLNAFDKATESRRQYYKVFKDSGNETEKL